MNNIISKSLDFLSKPLNMIVVAAFFLTSLSLLAMNFLPPNIEEVLKMKTYLSAYNGVIITVMFITFFLLVLQFLTFIYRKLTDIKLTRRLKKHQNSLFKDPEALAILNQLYNNSPKPVLLSILNQKVKLLHQYGLIEQATNTWATRARNPTMPYILQPLAEEKLKKLNRNK